MPKDGKGMAAPIAVGGHYEATSAPKPKKGEFAAVGLTVCICWWSAHAQSRPSRYVLGGTCNGVDGRGGCLIWKNRLGYNI